MINITRSDEEIYYFLRLVQRISKMVKRVEFIFLVRWTSVSSTSIIENVEYFFKLILILI